MSLNTIAIEGGQSGCIVLWPWVAVIARSVVLLLNKRRFFFFPTAFALWCSSQGAAACLAMTVNMITDLSALCKHGFVRSQLCASWPLASGLQSHANDSYANERHSELWGCCWSDSNSSYTFWSAGISYTLSRSPSPSCPALSHLCFPSVWGATAQQRSIKRTQVEHKLDREKKAKPSWAKWLLFWYL